MHVVADNFKVAARIHQRRRQLLLQPEDGARERAGHIGEAHDLASLAFPIAKLVPIGMVGYAVDKMDIYVENRSAGRGDKVCRAALLLVHSSQLMYLVRKAIITRDLNHACQEEVRGLRVKIVLRVW